MNHHVTTATAPRTATPLAEEWKRLGFVEGAPAGIGVDALAADVLTYRSLCCGSCGARRQRVTPYNRDAAEYRLLLTCRRCGAETEA